MTKNLIDDGFRADLVQTADFRGIMEIPEILPPDEIVIPTGIVPFTQRRKNTGHDFFVCFYEHDIRFRDCILAIDEYADELSEFRGIISPDCSLYIDMPLCLQIANIYMSRAIGHNLQSRGNYVVTNIRWGDERTYTTIELPEKVAFLGAPKHSIVSIGTYGCVKTKQDKIYFREGLVEMLNELEPEVVLVYGSMPRYIFEGLENRTRFICYPDWITFKKGGGR